MSNDKTFTIPGPSILDAIGGESLAGSGFEEETPDNGFTQSDPVLEGGER